MQEDRTYYRHGKLLLTAEYFVLDGALALAVPTRRGQRFTVRPTLRDGNYDLIWTIRAPGDTQASRYTFLREDWTHTRFGEDPVRARLQQLFYAAEKLRPRCTTQLLGRTVECSLEFPPDWGLGSSSTLVHFVATFLGVNAYDLLELTFDGSGYDVACADAAGPLLYRRRGNDPLVTPVDWRPTWAEATWFVHRNQKQNSREGIARYRETETPQGVRERISTISQQFCREIGHLRPAAKLLAEHERLVADALGLPPVGEEPFGDFDGTLKSLGAWGGDFIWALSERPAAYVRDYFNERGYPTVIAYNDMIL